MRATTVAVLLVVSSMAPVPARSSGEAVLRVGTYDNRAIAVAYAHSDHLPADEKKAELAAAKVEGDTAKMRELEAWGEKHQHELHLMGFSTAPVCDLLELVANGIPGVAENTGVDVIARACDYVGEGVEVVDVTMELVALFEPSQKAYDTIEQLKDVPPVDIGDIYRREH